LLQRLETVQEEAESTALDLTIRNIRTGMQLAQGELIMHGEDGRITELAQSNPVRFLGKLPDGYEGEAVSPEQPGGWTYNPTLHELAYKPRLAPAFAGRPELRWRYMPVLADGQIRGLRLEAMN
jgi:hypothetical protein